MGLFNTPFPKEGSPFWIWHKTLDSPKDLPRQEVLFSAADTGYTNSQGSHFLKNRAAHTGNGTTAFLHVYSVDS